MVTKTVYEGACHCRALGFAYCTSLSVEQWSVRACQCAFCTAHGALSTSDPAGMLEFAIHDPPFLQRYRFGLRTADFLLCTRCGVYIGARIDTDEGSFGIVNVRAFRARPASLPMAAAVEYGAEGAAERVQRRMRQWTPVMGVAAVRAS